MIIHERESKLIKDRGALLGFARAFLEWSSYTHTKFTDFNALKDMARDAIRDAEKGAAMFEDKSMEIVQAVLDDLKGRGALGDEWGMIDPDTRAEIMATWQGIIREILKEDNNWTMTHSPIEG